MAPSWPRATSTEHSSCSGSIFSSTQATRPQIIPGSGQLGGRLHAHLALAVVAHAGGFQNAGQQVVGTAASCSAVSITA